MSNSFSPNSIFLLLLLLLFLLPTLLPPLVQSSLIPLNESDDLIDEICKQTPHYDLCVASLKSNPLSLTSDIKGLASIVSDILLANAADTLNYIEGLIKQNPDPELEKPLAYCAELYIPVVKYSLPQAIDALSKGQYGFANYGISDSAKEASACEKKFSGSTKSPLTDRNNLVLGLSDVVTAIVKILLKG